MATWLKVIIGIVVAGVTLLVLLVGGMAYYYKAHKDDLLARMKKPLAEGQTFGQNASADACISEGFRRLAGIDGILAEGENNIFAMGCLSVATKSPTFCDGIPDPHAIMDTARWTLTTCQARSDVAIQPCQRFLQVWQHSCHPTTAP